MKFLVLLLIMCFSTLSLFAQSDISVKKPIINKAKKSNSKLSLPSLKVKKPVDYSMYMKKSTALSGGKEKKPISIVKKKKFSEPEYNFIPKAFTKDKVIKKEYSKDQYLGEFKSNTGYVTIVCRDHEYPDGDKVRILINDLVVHPSILLTQYKKRFLIDLKKGFNRIDFLALNQGTSGPNTAAFQVYDEDGVLLFSKQWNLTTGTKASMVIVKDK